MIKLNVIFLCLGFVISGLTLAATNDDKLATLKFHGIEVEPYKIDGKLLVKSKHTIKVKPGKHTVLVYLDWPGHGRSSEAKSACFIAKAGKQYLIGADTDDERVYQSDWSPYIEEISANGIFIRFLTLGFGRETQNCD